MYWLVVWLVWFRFPSDNCPGIKASCGHRGSNRQQDKRKTEGEPMGRPRVCKPKDSRENPELFHVIGRDSDKKTNFSTRMLAKSISAR
jgi:hypothetical protein